LAEIPAIPGLKQSHAKKMFRVAHAEHRIDHDPLRAVFV
jgi:hypothetical protein